MTGRRAGQTKAGRPAAATAPAEIGATAHVVIVHGALHTDRPDEADTLDQVREVAAALARLGHSVDTAAVSLDLSALAALAAEAAAIDADGPPLVFNLVEALLGDGRLIHLAPAVMEHAGLAFTGSSAAAIAVTTDKRLTKRLLAAAGLPVPAEPDDPSAPADALFIVKSLTEDASYGIDMKSVVARDAVAAEIEARAERFGGHWFAEAYIPGREFNLSVLEDAQGRPGVLPIAEIVFEGFADARPQIVDYDAKWAPDSFAYANTPRRFLAPGEDAALAAELSRIALAAFDLLGLAGYARIDFRVDPAGHPYVLEANANPCLSPDAGFAAAAREAGMRYDDLIARIIATARRHGGAPAAIPAS